MDTEFWNGKRVLLTGHTGFKGSWLSLWLQSMGADVLGYALAPPTNPSLFEVANVGVNMRSVVGDIRDIDLLRSAFSSHLPEIVIHMAAQPLVRRSYHDPVETYSTNVMGTVNLLEIVRKCDTVRAVVNVTSDKCYENREWLWGYRENEAMGGFDPYSSSKGCAELVTSAYRNSYFSAESGLKHPVALASARAGNVIGGGDWATDRLIPDVLRAFVDKQPVVIRNPHAIRPWQHVLEPLSGYLLLAQRLYESGSDYAEAWNFGPTDEDAMSVQWIVETIADLWGNGVAWKLDSTSNPHEANHLKLDCSKARSRLNWHPRWQLESALNSIVFWHRAFQQEQNLREITLAQIAAYVQSPTPTKLRPSK